MIIIKLSGGIGNNMFQYSSAKSVEIKKNLSFVYFNNKDLRYFKLKLIGVDERKREERAPAGAGWGSC